jgi:hypothetical protein
MFKFLLALWRLITSWKRGVRRIEAGPAEHIPNPEDFTSGIPTKPKVPVRRTAKRTPPKRTYNPDTGLWE